MNNQYQVQEIIGRKVYSGKVLYLVKWKGFPREESSWESIKVLKSVKHFVKEYNDKHKIMSDNFNQDRQIKPVIKGRRGRPRKNESKSRENNKAKKQSHHEIPDLFFDSDDDKKSKSNNSKNIFYKQEEKLQDEGQLLNLQEQLQTKSLRTETDAESEQLIQDFQHSPLNQVYASYNQPPKPIHQELPKPFDQKLPKAIEQKQPQPLSYEPPKPIYQEQPKPIIEDIVQVPLVATMTKFTTMTKSKEKQDSGSLKLKKIYFIQKTQDQKIQYLVQYSNGNLVKCFTEELTQKYSTQLIKFLEETLIAKTK